MSVSDRPKATEEKAVPVRARLPVELFEEVHAKQSIHTVMLALGQQHDGRVGQRLPSHLDRAVGERGLDGAVGGLELRDAATGSPTSG